MGGRRGQRPLIGTGVVAILLTGGLVATARAPWQATDRELASAEVYPGVAPAPAPTESSVSRSDQGLPLDPALPTTAGKPPASATTAPAPAPSTATSRAAPPPTAPARPAPPAAQTNSRPAVAPAPGSGFEGSVVPIDEATAARMASSWRPGCPVALSDLRLVNLTHWGFDGQPHAGELVVHRHHADRILAVFASLFQARFPIEQVRLVDDFGGDDDRSMAANNTSGFNCRKVAGTQRWSQHAYGRAVDINPVQNPYVLRGGEVRPPAGQAHLRRDPGVPGLITAGGPVVAALARVGWSWGGGWGSPDYQHFSATGR